MIFLSISVFSTILKNKEKGLGLSVIIQDRCEQTRLKSITRKNKKKCKIFQHL